MDDVVLDPQQETAAQIVEGPALILAGAGAGKTATLTERTARMLESGHHPENLLMLTFSRKAAREMYARLRDRLDTQDRKALPTIENFHSFGWKLLQSNPTRCQRKSGVSLMDANDQKKELRRLHKDLADDAFREDVPVKKLMTVHDVLSNEGIILGDQYARTGDENPERRQRIMALLTAQGIRRAHWGRLNDILRRYEENKRMANTVDFGDLVALPAAGLSAYPEWAAKLEERFTHIAVDEAQDTNRIQYAMLRLFSSHNNVIMVGDDDQCIYEWRGAAPSNLRTFRDETEAAIVRLERNYRSTPSIVSAAARHIACNQTRIEKSPYAEGRADGDPPDGQQHPDGVAMANAIAQDIREAIDSGISPKRIAILYRVNKIARVLEPALIARGIPYHIAQGIDVFQTPEAQLLMGAVRLVQNPQDSMAATKLAQLVKGLGERSLNDMIGYSVIHDLPILECRQHVKLSKPAFAAAERLSQMIDGLAQWPPLYLAEWALDPEMGGFQDTLKELSKTADKPKTMYERRLTTIMSIEEAIQGRFGTSDQGKADAEYSRSEQWEIVQELALAAPDEEAEQDAVTVATVFRVKGLEYHTVHIAGMSDGLMPMRRSSDKPPMFDEDEDEAAQNVEEERRLSYVAATRARERLVVHHADRIHWGYDEDFFTPSGFADEMGLTWREVEPVGDAGAGVSGSREIVMEALQEAAESE
ncbi:UvrD/REP helicase (plasmid) [Thioalkalivibrio sp. K90mix]|uniref:ATP-dependent helicase n=1 Tax=Thioalkalivibrio sp. (strain K90mix) TaxID=396595 RepID=UPI000195A4C9|nr:ATP-dependent helicase [Thioalkalivibrio sp. K90mix]ADC73192.1 UvrD/REP helicase [Thioalkalivibrio sp. K90mix]